MNTAVIRPGILVALKTTLSGGVSYVRKDLETGLTEEELKAIAKENGTKIPAITRWETVRTIDDPADYEAASKVRNLAGNTIRGACAKTSFGLLCTVEQEAALDAACATAQKVVEDHNATSPSTRVTVHCLKGRIAGTDEEAARAIVKEVQDLIDDMNRGIEQLDPKAIRDAAQRATDMGSMLAPAQAETVEKAVEAARRAARVIVKRVEKGGEEGAVVLADLQRGALERARIAFLEFDAPAAIGEATPAVDMTARAAAIEIDEGPVSEEEPTPAPVAPTTVTAPAPEFDFEDQDESSWPEVAYEDLSPFEKQNVDGGVKLYGKRVKGAASVQGGA